MDSRGADLSKHCRISQYACANKCRNNTACVAFTWVETGRTGAQCCYTKSRLQDPLTPFRAGDAGYTYARDDGPAPTGTRSVFVFGDSLSDTGGMFGQ
ncbi:hypothetical protein FOA52_004882 [Chlamydomonas sp. UWO 241]|nr:hypothetical protein FOA52_004882 [Chlamydomonas sp. UWO 241]